MRPIAGRPCQLHLGIWSGRRESNPHQKFGRLLYLYDARSIRYSRITPKNVSAPYEVQRTADHQPPRTLFLEKHALAKKFAKPPHRAQRMRRADSHSHPTNVDSALLRYNLWNRYFAAAFTLDGF